MKVRLFQIIAELDQKYLMFRALEEVKAASNGRVPSELYETVYNGILDVKNPEEVFTIFNINFPKDYKGRSMSVSDVVEFEHVDGSDFYYCNTIGFAKVEFDKEKCMLPIFNHNFDRVFETRNDVMIYAIGNGGLIGLDCAEMVLQRCRYSQCQLGYEIIYRERGTTQPKSLTFTERPSIIVTKHKTPFPKALLYETVDENCRKMIYGAHSKDNLGIVCGWLQQQNYEFENL